jgi:GTP-binding protein
MRARQVAFLTSALRVEDLPQYPFPEVAFAGRSNVGKSSLINTLVAQRRLARVGATPGQTRSINLYPVDSEWVLVDLPGYGYARVSLQQRKNFHRLVMQYLLEREQLVLACVLTDARNDPTRDDLALMEELELNHRQFAVILTKADTLTPSAVEERRSQLLGLVANCSSCAGVIATSAHTKIGRHQVWSLIQNAVQDYRARQSKAS